VGTGMVSGGIQHFADGPNFAAILIPLGFCTALLAFMFRDYRKMFSLRYIYVVIFSSALAWLVFQQVAQLVPPESHHTDEVMGSKHAE
jgi:predicted Abi (CAAX) family protease